MKPSNCTPSKFLIEIFAALFKPSSLLSCLFFIFCFFFILQLQLNARASDVPDDLDYNIEVTCSQPTATYHITESDCGSNNGQIYADAYGGGAHEHYYALAGYNYDGPWATYTWSNLAPGDYTIYISSNPHDHSCQVAYNIHVPEKTCAPSCSPPTATYHVTEADCGYHNGQIYVDGTGGGAHEHYYSIGGNYDGPWATYKWSNLAPGDYTIYISSNPQDHSCQVAYNIHVPEKTCAPSCSPPTATYHVTESDCNSNNGQIYVDGSGGGANHHYYSIGGNYDGPHASYTWSNLAPGDYTVYISSDPHEQSCQVTYNIHVPEKDCGPSCSPPTATYHVTESDCNSNNGQIYVDGTGGGAIYHYYSIGGNFEGPLNSYTFNHLAPGNYTVYISSDPHEQSCQVSYPIHVPEKDCGPTCSPPTATFHVTKADCGYHNGQIYVDGFGGGVNHHYYSIGGNYYGPLDTYTFRHLAPGSYTVYISSDPHESSCQVFYTIHVPEEDCGPATCQVDLGPDLDFCAGLETCQILSLSGLDASNDAVNEVNSGNILIGNARLSIQQSFNGSSVLDENEITSSQTTGALGISSGVSHQGISNAHGGLANAMVNQYNFDVPVCNLEIEIWDIDRNDQMVLTASGPNGPVTYTFTDAGASVSVSGNTFTSLAGAHNYPGDGLPTLGKFTIEFDDCVSQVQTEFYDIAHDEGNGGSYSIVFNEGCTNNTLETCQILSLSGLDASNDAVNEVNSGHVVIGNARLTIQQSFDGSSVLDENEITSSQTTGALGISSGVSHQGISNAHGGLANAMVNQYNFDVPVCNLEIEIWDIDRNDEMVLTASGPNGPVTYTVIDEGASVSVFGNTFTSTAGANNYPGNGPATLGKFTVVFDDCVTQVQTLYYDIADNEGDGGSYSIVFNEGCTDGPLETGITLQPSFSSQPECHPSSLSYEWSTGSTASTISVTQTGTYSVTITDCSGCVATDDIVVTFGPDSGTLTLDGDNPTVVCGEDMAMISATPDGNIDVPAGFEVIYVLTEGAELVIIDVNATPDFNVPAPGEYTIHTLVYDPNTLDLNIVVFGTTTGFDVNGLLIQGGGQICASLDVAGAPVVVETIGADSGTLTLDGNNPTVVCGGGMAMISATPDGNIDVPAGFEVIYVLTEGAGLVIVGANPTPEFNVAASGDYTIHTLVYDPNTLDLNIIVFGTTTGFDVNGLLIQGGGDICASLDVAGAPVVVEIIDIDSGTLTLDGDNPTLVCDGDMAMISATPDGNINVPAGFEVIYVLTEGAGLVLIDANPTPEFNVAAPGDYTIHTLVYDPNTLDLNIIVFGTTTGFDVNGLLIQGGGDICASLDVAGAPVVVETIPSGDAGLIAEGSANNCVVSGQSVLRNATLSGQVVPAGYRLVIILVDSNGNIVDVNSEPEFLISMTGDYSIHPVVYNPSVCDVNSINTVAELLECSCVAINLVGVPVSVQVCDENIVNCPEVLYVPGPNSAVAPGLYESSKTISSDGLIMSGSVEYSAGEEIQLMSGFEVMSGQEFNAHIEGCNPNQ